ncbi:hypothetical protein LB523_20330 [Mesorhizobium sp. ESP-6-4]|nr:hypothetical protein [Mesorhizobium sp. ESP-6-4]MBZ9661394.1 hypothetical protein [Mesorhizobium sp. ESP-6-4]
MIRPEPPSASAINEVSRFWEGNFAGPGRFFSVGNIVRLEASPPPANFAFPHATEDRLVDLSKPMDILGQLTLVQTAQAVAGGTSPTLEAAFDGGLVRAASTKAYVLEGHIGRSLGAIEITADRIQFHVATNPNNGKQQLRAHIAAGNHYYDLSVPADAARGRWKTSGLASLQDDANASNRIHVRVGLSRPFAGNPCYSQVNGLYFL